MLAKDMCLEKNKFLFFTMLFILLLQKNILAEEGTNKRVVEYFKDLKFFSANFIQSDENYIGEGRLYIGLNRIRVEYDKPEKILIILDKNKAMYYNYNLDEDEFFDPGDTSAWFFFDIFNNPDFFIESSIREENNSLVLKKRGVNDLGNYEINIILEDSPLLIRKIKLYLENSSFVISIFNHKYNESYDKDFFKLINPSFFN